MQFAGGLAPVEGFFRALECRLLWLAIRIVFWGLLDRMPMVLVEFLASDGL